MSGKLMGKPAPHIEKLWLCPHSKKMQYIVMLRVLKLNYNLNKRFITQRERAIYEGVAYYLILKIGEPDGYTC